jgi:hypothetical protein
MNAIHTITSGLRYGRIDKSAHEAHPWRIHAIAADFQLEDVWALPTPGGADDFHLLVSRLLSGSPPEEGMTPFARLLWALRWQLGKWFGWDHTAKGLGSRVASLRDRLPADLRDCQVGSELKIPQFKPLYQLHNECASEIANSTVHAVLHFGWVEDGAGGYCGQMAVLVKPNGFLGAAYLALIKPFRHLIIYPELMRKFEREWKKDCLKLSQQNSHVCP